MKTISRLSIGTGALLLRSSGCAGLKQRSWRNVKPKQTFLDRRPATGALFAYVSRETARTRSREAVVAGVLIGCSWALVLLTFLSR